MKLTNASLGTRFAPAAIATALVALAWLAIGTAHATIMTVTTNNDEFGISTGFCSLREAVQAANTNLPFGGCPAGSASVFDIIMLPPRRYQLDLGDLGEDSNAEGDLDVYSSIIVSGVSGAARTIIESAGNRDRLFDQNSSAAALYLIDLTLRGGDIAGATVPDGGVIRRPAGAVRVIRSVVTGGVARSGGGIYSNGSNGELQITDSTIFGNTATFAGGGLYTAGSIEAVLTNVTISGNFAANGGGGISAVGNLQLASSTIAFNRSAGSVGAGGLAFTGPIANGDSIVFYNSIFADNSDGFGGATSDISCGGATLHGGGFNLIQRSTCALAQSNGSFTGDARLSPLFDFGAGIPTHALLTGSAALDAGAPSTSGVACPDADARGVFRPDADCDVGAYEQAYDFSVNTVNDAVDASVGDGLCRTAGNQCSLRAAVQEANQSQGRHVIRLPSGNYILSLAGSGGAGGDLDVNPIAADGERQIAIFGSGASAARITSSGADRVFDIHGDFTNSSDYPTAVALVGVRITGGHVVGATNGERYGGGIHLSNAQLLLVDAIVSGNRIDDGDGGGLGVFDTHFAGDQFDPNIRATTVLDRVAVIDNYALATVGGSPDYRGGGVYVDRGDLYATNSTFSQNHADSGGGVSVDASSSTVAYGSATLVNVTIAANRVKRFGGGVYFTSLTVEAKDSIIADNGFEPGMGLGSPDCYAAVARPLISLGYNLIGDATACALAGDVITNEIGVNARISGLLQPGGQLPVHYLYPDSPALNLVPSTQCAGAESLRVWHDQNYASRPAPGSSACDAGATEGAIVQPPDMMFADSFETEAL